MLVLTKFGLSLYLQSKRGKHAKAMVHSFIPALRSKNETKLASKLLCDRGNRGAMISLPVVLNERDFA
jgi:hypothetical protein